MNIKIPESTKKIVVENGKLKLYGDGEELVTEYNLSNTNISLFYDGEDISTFDAIKCSCGGHMLTMSTFNDDDDEFAYMEGWHPSRSLPPPLWYRIKSAFRMLCGKIPFIDEYVFNLEQLMMFRAMLDKYIEIMKLKKMYRTVDKKP